MRRLLELYSVWAPALFLALIVLAAPSLAHASDDEDDSEGTVAKLEKLRSDGYALFKRQKYKDAFFTLKEILPLTINRDEALLLDLGNLAELLADCRSAALYWSGYLALAPNAKPSSEVRQKRDKCLHKTGAVGKLAIDIDPAGGDLIVNDVWLGQGTVRELTMPVGTYAIQGRARGHVTQRQSLDVQADTTARTKLTLAKRIYKGGIDISVEPGDGAEVLLDNVSLGKPPVRKMDLDTRKYLIRVEKPGWDRWVRYVTVERNTTVKLKVTLEKTGADIPIPPLPKP